MKLYDGGTTVLIIIGVAALVGFLSSRWLGDDNVIEEFSEEIIESNTGIDIDLTPGTQEPVDGKTKSLLGSQR